MILSDKEIKKRVMDELYWDSSIDSSKVNVTVDRGKVTLSGTVPSYAARTRAEDDACRIRDVTWIENRITVKYPAVPAVPTDADIKQTVVNYLSADADMEKTDVRVSVRDGIVTLEGSVDEYWKKGEAGRIACRARGVCDIVNKLTVVPTRSIADKVIADEVRAAIERNFNGASECTTVRVANGIVTLSGMVPTWAARRAAVTAAEFTRGVLDVFDDLSVAGPGTAKGVC